MKLKEIIYSEIDNLTASTENLRTLADFNRYLREKRGKIVAVGLIAEGSTILLNKKDFIQELKRTYFRAKGDWVWSDSNGQEQPLEAENGYIYIQPFSILVPPSR